MSLFESIESDVAALFVSQGSVFDALTRSLMERTARVESRVDALATNVTGNFQSANQLIQSVSATVDAHAAALARQLEQVQSQHQAAAAADGVNINISNNSSASSNTISSSSTLAVSPTTNDQMDTHELEYYIMTLSRQLHVVLELFFQPYAHDVAHGIQAKQAQFETISDVLTQNEVILMELSAVGAHVSIPDSDQQQQQEQQPDQVEQEPKDESNTHIAQDPSVVDPILETHEDEASNGNENELHEEEVEGQGTPKEAAASSQEEEVDKPSDDDNQTSTPASAMETELPVEDDMEELLPVDTQPSTETAPDDLNPSEFSPATTIPGEPPSEAHIREARVREQTDREGRRRIGKPAADSDSYSSRKRKKSLYDSFRDFHTQQLTEDERHRLKEQELLRKVQQLLQAARKQWQQEAAASMALTWQLKLQDLESQQLKLQREWQYHQQQTPNDLMLLQQQQQQQKEYDRQFAAFSATFLTSQQSQEQQIARILESLREFQDQFVQKADFDSMASAWLQTARDECVFGVNADALASFKQGLEDFQTQLGNQELSPLIGKLLDEVNSVLELLNKVLELLGSDGDGLHGSEGFQLMQTLRTFLTMLDDLAQNLESDKESSAKSAAFISETLRQMELGTANLLEAFEAQQDRYQQIFEQQQLAISQLQRELWDQKQADQELKSHLAGCPSQEDTMRFIQELRDQINASTSDSATRMLETVDELRLRMGGLPNAEVIERLAQAIQKKADRAEMDRLERLLVEANSGPVAPVGSLMKMPMKCLSCDQNLPYAHTSRVGDSVSSPEHHGHPHHHQSQHHHTCSHEPQTPEFYYYAQPPGSPEPGFRELFAATSTAAASRRRKQRQLNLSLALSPNNLRAWSDVAGLSINSNRAFVNLDDGRNRIPLRRTVLSDHVVYGPAITPNAFKKRTFASGAMGNRMLETDQQRTSRPKTAIPPDRRGEIITRSVSSTVIIRPFAEQQRDLTAEKRSKH